MSILTGPVNATATTFSVSDDSLLLRNGLPQMLQVESEKFLIRGYEAVGTHNTRWYVERGVDGSLAASHSGGVAIAVVTAGGGGGGVSVTDGLTTVAAATSLSLPSGTVSDLGGGVAGVRRVLAQQVGPVHIVFSDPDLVGAGKLIAALAAGAVVWDAAVIPTADWDSGVGQTFLRSRMVLNSTPPGGGGSAMFAFDLLQAQAVNNRVLVAAPKTDLFGYEQGLIRSGGSFDPGGLYLKVEYDGAGLAAGEADVYAVIAMPAS